MATSTTSGVPSTAAVATTTATTATAVISSGGQSREKVLAGLKELQNHQRAINSKILELEHDLNEHVLVTEALKEVDPKRKCFRLIGGVLVEKSVGEILPSVLANKDLIGQTIEALKDKATQKSNEIRQYVEKHP
ncbi:prefoldin 2 [Brevipalpus obovatus]|uniref:prefoldin 2 n=1 Tax=Brevipalpus obovatus TaxID=246614 RepID=UPI003D9E54CA